LSLVEEYHAAHKARLARMGAPPRYQAPIRHQPAPVIIKPAPVVLTVEPKAPAPLYQIKPERKSFVPVARRILCAVANEFEVTISDITERDSHAERALPRFVAIGLMSDLTNMSLVAIGKQLGGRDHTTIWHGRNRIKALLTEEAFHNRYEQIRAGIAA
jgi:hypothetical protein